MSVVIGGPPIGDDDAVEETITVTLPLISHDDGVKLTFVEADVIEPDASVHVEARGENSIFGVSELVYAALTVAHEAFMEKAEFEAEKETYSTSVEKSFAEMHFAPRPIAVTGAPKKKPGPTRGARIAKSAADYSGVSTVRRMVSGRTPCETFVNCAVIVAACGAGGLQVDASVRAWAAAYGVACNTTPNSPWLTALTQMGPVMGGWTSHGPCAAFLAANEYVVGYIRNMLFTPVQFTPFRAVTLGMLVPSTLHALFRGARKLTGAALTGLSRTVCAPLAATGLVQRAPPRSDANQEEPPSPPEEGAESDVSEHVHEKSGRRYLYNKKTKQVAWIDPPRAK
jgi:hypothetical protein